MQNNYTTKNKKINVERAKEPRYLTVDMEIWDNLTPDALKVYGQLRKLVSFKSETDDTQITVKALSKLSGISERKTYTVLNELEFEHFIIERLNKHHCRYGQSNYFSVSQTYMFFKQIEQEFNTPAENDMGVQNLTTPAEYAVATAEYAVATAKNDILSTQESFQQLSQETNSTAKPSSSSFFSSSQTTSLLANKHSSDIRSNELFLSHCEHHVINNSSSKFKRVQQIAGLNKILKKLYEEGLIFESLGYGAKEEEIKKHGIAIDMDAQDRMAEEKLKQLSLALKNRSAQLLPKGRRRFA